MRSTQIRDTFLDFFAARGHHRLPAAPLVPDDPTLLLTNAGMAQFKPWFLGETEPAVRRATTVQKCVRTVDVENVGRTARHATFFEMLGNFSFGDYFSAEAVAYAWELLTEGYGLDPGRLWVTVLDGDEETERLWRRAGVPAARVQRLGPADNYWSMGVPGPCGPCTDVTYDRGPAFGRAGGPAVDGERYVELWSIVFMQSRRGEDDGHGGFPVLGDLAARSIDTGLGLDRLAAVLQDAENVCTTDLLRPTLAAVEELAGRPYPGRGEDRVSFQVVTEHARTIAFLIADGVLPAKDGRGYVLRRLMRRAVRHARRLGVDEPVLSATTASVIRTLGGVWPELIAQAPLIERVVTAEEESFGRTLAQGTRLLDAAIGRTRGQRRGTLPGETAFELADTYGFPLELTVEAAGEAGLEVDEDRFAALLARQRERARSGGRARTAEALRRRDAYRAAAAAAGPTSFTGYEELDTETEILAVLRDGAPVRSAPEGSEVELVLARSPFYARAGGQIGDSGTVRTASGALVEVTDTWHALEELRVHAGRVTAGEARAGEPAFASVDAPRRRALTRAHSATHILHAVVRAMFGEHAAQRGSLVEPDRLRFDFAHQGPVPAERLTAVEAAVNAHVLADPAVRAWYADRAGAEAAGALALFGERYGEQVRIVDIGDFSRELCGGTHVAHGAQVGAFRLLGESGIGTGLRRITALTGHESLQQADTERQVLAELTAQLGVPTDNAPRALRDRLGTLRTAQDRLDRLRTTELHEHAERLANGAHPLDGGRLVVARVPEVTARELRGLAADTVGRLGGGRAVVVLGAEENGKALLAAALSPDLHAGGAHAGAVLAEAARTVGGGTGGHGPIAAAGGRKPEALDRALATESGGVAGLLGA